MTAVVYGVLWLLCNVLGRVLFRYRALGREHVPSRGGVLIAANHASYLDIPLLGCGIPRRVAFLGRQDLFPGFRWLFRWLGWIPIRLDRLDREGFGKAIRLIRSGRVVAIYPEGRRTTDGRLQPGRPGIGIIVAEAACPVIPAYITGTREALPVGASWIRCHPVQVTYGEPIDFTTDTQRYSGKEFYRHVSRTVMAKIAELGHVAPPSEPSERAERPDTSPAAQPRNAE